MASIKGVKVREQKQNKPKCCVTFFCCILTPAALLCEQERLPTVPLAGMFNKSGGKVRLTFKLEQDQLWLGTKGETVADLVFSPLFLFLIYC